MTKIGRVLVEKTRRMRFIVYLSFKEQEYVSFAICLVIHRISFLLL